MVGFGGLAGAEAPTDPLRAKAPHFPAKAKRVIYLFLNGGPSQVDTFDPKPKLDEYNGKPIPSGNLRTERKTGNLLKSPFTFKKYGQSGIEVSEIFPEAGRVRRRPVRHPVDVHGPAQSRAVAVHAEQRRETAGPAVHGIVGHLRARARRTRTCRASSCCARGCRWWATSFGARPSCRRSIRARTSIPRRRTPTR